jgi:hypothetical protein
LEKDVAKAMTLREVLKRAEPVIANLAGWETVLEPLRSQPRARAAWEAWRGWQANPPSPDSPAFLEHHDAERRAYRAMVEVAEEALGPRAELLREELRQRLETSNLKEGTPVWRLAWDHHWGRVVCQAWAIEP